VKSFHDGKVILHAGDCLDVLRAMPADSIDAVVTDPPYHLTSIVKRFGSGNAAPAKGNEAFIRASRGFMGKQWDGGDIAFRAELWAEVLRVLKPGGHMVCFGGTRTYHRMTCAIEDAGFEIRDAIMWHYGSGFPKSHDVSKGIDRAAGESGDWTLRPGGQKRGGGNIMGQCVPTDGQYNYSPATDAARQWQGYGTALKPSTEIICLARKPLSEGTVAANVLRWGTGAINIDGCRIEHDEPLTPMAAQKDGDLVFGQAGRRGETTNLKVSGRWPANLCHDGSPEVLAGFPETAPSSKLNTIQQAREPQSKGAEKERIRIDEGYIDSGSAARFFYTAKADWDDRLNSKHPTVKPVDLMQWLVRLVCPKGATVLDPFAGTGTTGAAAFIEGCRAVLIEREAEYLADIEKRMELLLSGRDERLWKTVAADPAITLPLFAGLVP
jgi:DNA modification methylase